jgi:hypothetical protein
MLRIDVALGLMEILAEFVMVALLGWPGNQSIRLVLRDWQRRMPTHMGSATHSQRPAFTLGSDS